MADINEYPRFSNGDVLVVSPTGRSWQLQSSTLKNSLKLFRDLLEKQEPKKLTKRHRYEGKVIQWMLKMIICDPNDLRFVDFEAVVGSQCYIQTYLNNCCYISVLKNLYPTDPF